MIVRRKLILSGTVTALAAMLPRDLQAADDPTAILTAIYSRVTKARAMVAAPS